MTIRVLPVLTLGAGLFAASCTPGPVGDGAGETAADEFGAEEDLGC